MRVTISAIMAIIFCAPLLAQNIKVSGEYQLMPVVTSPFTLYLEGEYHSVQWLLGDDIKRSGTTAEFEAEPGIHRIRVYGLVWENGDFKPKVKKENRVYVIEGSQLEHPPSTTGGWQDAPMAVPLEIEPPPDLRGVKITMFTDKLEDSECKPCIEWWRDERPKFVERGALVSKLSVEGLSEQFKKSASVPDHVPWFMIEWYGKRYQENGILNSKRLAAAIDQINTLVEKERVQ